MYIGCRLGTEVLFLVPETWRFVFIERGGRIIREATIEEGTTEEPVLLSQALRAPPSSLSPTLELRTEITPPKIVLPEQRGRGRPRKQKEDN